MGSFCSRIPCLHLGLSADTLNIIKLTLEFIKLYIWDAMYPKLESGINIQIIDDVKK